MENPTAVLHDRAAQISAVLHEAAALLSSRSIESARLDAELLLCHVLGCSREQLVLAAQVPLGAADRRAFQALLARRLAREPVAYLTGTREFWSLPFHVTSDVLIPRPETELLIETAVDLAAKFSVDGRLRIVDVGTGSGAIAVALAAEIQDAEIYATEISAPALALAQENAQRHGLGANIRFVCGDLFEGFGLPGSFHLILSNPPYIPAAEIDALQPEVSRWEPRQALNGGADGLDFYRRIAAAAWRRLAPDGAVILETADGSARSAAALFENNAGYRQVRIVEDYAGSERIIVACSAGTNRG